METAATQSPPLAPSFWAHLRRWLRPPRRLRFTREGWYFFFISIGVGLAAINTGNNLLYLVLGMTLSLIIVSGILSEVALRNLGVRRKPPNAIYAGRPFLMGISLSNNKTRYPSFSVEVEDLLSGNPLEKKCYFLKVPATRTQQTSYRYQFSRRGAYPFTGFRVSTKFPFALFRKSRLVDESAEVVVFPALIDVSSLLRLEQPSFGELPRPRAGRGEDFHALREFQAGDDSRDIHWRATAKAGRLLIREREAEASRQVAICLFSRAVGGDESSDVAAECERAVSIAASLASHYLALGFRVSLTTLSGAVPAGTGAAHVTRILRHLATMPFQTAGDRWSVPRGVGIDRIAVVHRRAVSRLPAPRSFSKVIEVGKP